MNYFIFLGSQTEYWYFKKFSQFDAYPIVSTCFTQSTEFVISSGDLRGSDSQKWETKAKVRRNYRHVMLRRWRNAWRKIREITWNAKHILKHSSLPVLWRNRIHLRNQRKRSILLFSLVFKMACVWFPISSNFLCWFGIFICLAGNQKFKFYCASFKFLIILRLFAYWRSS